jgi:hypothetical protein
MEDPQSFEQLERRRSFVIDEPRVPERTEPRRPLVMDGPHSFEVRRRREISVSESVAWDSAPVPALVARRSLQLSDSTCISWDLLADEADVFRVESDAWERCSRRLLRMMTRVVPLGVSFVQSLDDERSVLEDLCTQVCERASKPQKNEEFQALVAKLDRMKARLVQEKERSERLSEKLASERRLSQERLKVSEERLALLLKQKAERPPPPPPPTPPIRERAVEDMSPNYTVELVTGGSEAPPTRRRRLWRGNRSDFVQDVKLIAEAVTEAFAAREATPLTPAT